MDIVNEIIKWPVIIQGALGSFLFWILFMIGQKATLFFNDKFKKENELGSYFGRYARDNFYKKNYELSNFGFFVCIYASIHYFLKFVLAAFISFLIKDFIPVFAYIGYGLATYFLFRAISYVTHFSKFDKEDENSKKNKNNEEK